MNVSLIACAALLVALLLVGLLRHQWLLAPWVMSFLVFPTARAKIGEAPIYLYDLIAVSLIVVLAVKGELRSWPRGVPRWHWWFIGAAFLFSVVFGVVQHGMVAEVSWIWLHSSLAWMAFAFGVIVTLSPSRERYRAPLIWGVLLSAILFCVIGVIQYAELPGTSFFSNLFYGDIGSEESVEMLRRGLETNRAPGPHFAPTTFAGMALLTVVVFWLLTRETDRFRRWLVLVLCAVTLLCTVSRHAMLAAVIGLIVTMVLSELKKKVKLVLAVGVSALLLFTPAVGYLLKESWTYRLSKWDEGVLEDDNTAARVLWGPARLIEFIANEPLVLLTGSGLDPEKLASKSHHEVSFESGFVSNGFLLMLYYLGLGGFLLHAVFWGWAAHIARKFPPRSRGAICGFIAVAIVIVAADNYGAMYEPAVALLFLIVGLMAGQWRLEFQEAPVPEEAPESEEALAEEAYAA